jgi:DNA-binding IclR family transcriptional regulator
MKSFEKMFNILALYSMERTHLSISEVEDELGYPKSTVFRILNSLEKFNYIERNQENHRYHLGINFFRLGSIVQSQLDIRNVSLPTMRKLVESTSETVELNIRDGINRVCVEKVDSPLPVRNFVRVGERRPLFLGASGKVLLAFIPEAEQDKIIYAVSQETHVDKVSLSLELEKIRSGGFAITRGERIPDSFAVAAPIHDKDGQMVACLTIAGPIQRLTADREPELIERILNASSEISTNLGYSKPNM